MNLVDIIKRGSKKLTSSIKYAAQNPFDNRVLTSAATTALLALTMACGGGSSTPTDGNTDKSGSQTAEETSDNSSREPSTTFNIVDSSGTKPAIFSGGTETVDITNNPTQTLEGLVFTEQASVQKPSFDLAVTPRFSSTTSSANVDSADVVIGGVTYPVNLASKSATLDLTGLSGELGVKLNVTAGGQEHEVGNGTLNVISPAQTILVNQVNGSIHNSGDSIAPGNYSFESTTFGGLSKAIQVYSSSDNTFDVDEDTLLAEASDDKISLSNITVNNGLNYLFVRTNTAENLSEAEDSSFNNWKEQLIEVNGVDPVAITPSGAYSGNALTGGVEGQYDLTISGSNINTASTNITNLRTGNSEIVSGLGIQYDFGADGYNVKSTLTSSDGTTANLEDNLNFSMNLSNMDKLLLEFTENKVSSGNLWYNNAGANLSMNNSALSDRVYMDFQNGTQWGVVYEGSSNFTNAQSISNSGQSIVTLSSGNISDFNLKLETLDKNYSSNVLPAGSKFDL